MYSTRHHIAYWLLSCTATATHEITSKFLPSDSLHLLLFVPSATYALHAIWKGPSNQLSTSSSRPPLLHVLTTWCLLTSLGHLVQYMHLPTAPAEGTRWIRVLIHTCLAFNILGILEPIRQNRYDVQPFSDLSTLTKPRRSNLFLCSSWAFLSIGITEALNLGLGGLSGSRVSLWVIFWSLASTLEQNFNFFSALILSWALTSLSDVAMPVSGYYLALSLPNRNVT
ncbi:hypothetical protein QBC44DRAFT_386913 [Cladorrhinum sp. PSN332]|nr:hypothetical protein QBC44DRAFT_386913 [Cladorrhinum sp. PSN332]